MGPGVVGDDDPVVIVGFSFRFPQDAISEDKFWDILRHGKSTMTEVPEGRFNINGFHANGKNRPGTMAARGGHFLKSNLSEFDASFFNMGGMEAQAMDPQLRMLLETSYHALESAGMALGRVMGSQTSVYLGNFGSEYALLYGSDDEINEKYQATGNSGAMLSNRLSRFYDFHGPSMTLDTACSSSLLGIHLAVQSLRSGESEMSLVCGSQLQLEPRSLSVQASRLNFLSPDSQSYSFDERANGYSRGEGIGVVVLKRLSKALEDGDTIRAVIRSTSANHDGRTASSTQPSSTAQAALIRKAYEPLGFDFASTGYFEAHGTGTAVGDPIEIRGVHSVFSKTRAVPLFIGSVKANIGHLEAAAGIAGLIKAVLTIEKGTIPPNALLRNLNPAIRAEAWNLHFPTSAIDWPSDGLRRASINSFGFGGANAHVVIDDAFYYLQSRGLKGAHNTNPTRSLSNGGQSLLASRAIIHGSGKSSIKKGDPTFLFPITAADEQGVQRYASALASHLAQIGDGAASVEYLHDLAWTLNERRSVLAWRSFVSGSSLDQLQLELSTLAQKPEYPTESPVVRFAFTGQGAQWAAMGKELFETYPVFRDSMVRADSFFRSLGSTWSLVDDLYGPVPSPIIDHPIRAQPFCTALQIALVDLLASWEVFPQAVVGHSSGEIAAAYAAGALTNESALRVAYFRGEVVSMLSEKDPKASSQGSMLAVALSEAELAPHIAALTENDDDATHALTCACINSPRSTTVSGTKNHIKTLAVRLQEAGVFVRELRVPVAYHSPQMYGAVESYTKALVGTLSSPDRGAPRSLQAKFFSSVTATAIPKEELLMAEYWVSNLVSRVNFSEAFELMASCWPQDDDSEQAQCKRASYIVEVGPHVALERPIKDILGTKKNWAYDCLMRRGVPSGSTVTSFAGRLFTSGVPVKIDAVNTHRHHFKTPRMLLDLPLYPFDHSKSYWLESPLSKNHRFRKAPRHDFLGSRSRDWNPSEPKWQFTIRQSDLPWVLDHKIEGTTIYPAAGMLVMVLEAIKSLTDDLANVAGFRLREISITSALLVPATDTGVEVHLHMHQQQEASLTNPFMQTWGFRIYSTANSIWKLHCSGQVYAEEIATTAIDDEKADRCNTYRSRALGTDKEEAESVQKRSLSRIDVTQFYKELTQRGVTFGDTFQRLTGISVNAQGREAVATCSFTEWTQLSKDYDISPHVIHPTTLDGFLQVILAAGQQDLETLPAMVPTKFAEVYFTRGLLDHPDRDIMTICGSVTQKGLYHLSGDAIGVDSVSGEPLVVMRGCLLSGFGDAGFGKGTPEQAYLFHHLEWKPDVALLSNSGIEKYCIQKANESAAMVGSGGVDPDFEIVARYFMAAAMEQVTPEMYESYDASKFQLRKYIDWLKEFFSNSTVTHVDRYHDISPDFLETIASSSLDKKNLVLFGQNLVPILKEEVDPLALLFNEGILVSFYQGPLFNLTTRRLAAYLDLLAHQKSDMDIIEVGAGTGSTTSIVLDTLYQQGKHRGSPRFNHYDFTDISTAFFANAQERYSQQASQMGYRTLDLEKDPVAQGFEAHSYDVVIAASVLHATRNIEKTLNNVKKLLKPGGQLLLSEPTNLQMASIPFFSGVIQGWWLSEEEYRAKGPLLSIIQWNDVLKRSGFDGLKIALPDGPEETHGLSFLVSQVVCDERTSRTPSTVIVHETDEQKSLAVSIQAHMDPLSQGLCEIMSTDAFATDTSEREQCICLYDLGRPVIDHLNKMQFECLQRMVATSKEVLWINDGCGETAEKPEASMISGFAKTVARERANLSFVHLNVELGPSTLANILRLIDHRRGIDPREHETDLLEQNGEIYIPRAVEAPHVNRLFHSEVHQCKVEATDSELVKDPLRVTFVPGQLDSFQFISDKSVPLEVIPPDEIEVHVKATGINFKDVLVALNRVHAQYIGQEFAGVVTRVGSTLAPTLRPGDRVCGLAPGTFRSHVRTKRSCIMKVPSTMSYTEAAASPLVYVTAHYALVHLARLEEGEIVLVHAAAGGVGQAAIQIAQSRRARILVTAGTAEKRQNLIERYGIDPADVFSSRDVRFAEQVMERTGRRGLDVVLNSLSGRALLETWRCIAPLGRFIEIGKRDIDSFNKLPMSPFNRSVSFCSVDIEMILKNKNSLLQQLMEEVEQLVYTDSPRRMIAPQPITIFQRSELEEALRLMQTGQHMGKMVVDWEMPDTIQIIQEKQLDYMFDSSATYVIAGGLGGIGRNISSWLHQNGAKHLILLSRSGPQSEAAKQLLAKLEEEGVEVYAPPCDITNSLALEAVLQYARQNMPPIKGCIQSTMVIENRVFRDYTLEAFQSSIDPKVRGTWNLDSALPAGLDFFVLLSSLAGVHGAISQSNYAAGCSFLDAFARNRRQRGERCVSLDIGLVDSIGYIAERADARQALAMTYMGQKVVTERNLHFMLRYAIQGGLPSGFVTKAHTGSGDAVTASSHAAVAASAWDTQLICGMTTPAWVQRGGTVKDFGWMRIPMFCHLYQMELDVTEAKGDVAEQADSAGSQLKAAASVDEAAETVAALFARRLARSLSVPIEGIDTKRPPFTYGVDSLVAVELVHWFSTEIRAELPVVQLLGHMSIAELARVAAENSDYLVDKPSS